MIRAILNKYWRDHPTNTELCVNIPSISHLIRDIIIRYACHCYRSDKEIVNKVIHLNQNNGKTMIGYPHKTFLGQLKNDVDLYIGDMKNAMKYRDVWKRIVTNARATRSTQ